MQKLAIDILKKVKGVSKGVLLPLAMKKEEEQSLFDQVCLTSVFDQCV